MSKFVVVVFPSEAQAYQGARALKDLHAEGSVRRATSALGGAGRAPTLEVGRRTPAYDNLVAARAGRLAALFSRLGPIRSGARDACTR